MGPPSNALEQLLQRCVHDPAMRPTFARMLLDAYVWVLGTTDRPSVNGIIPVGANVQMFHFDDSDGRVLPFFTSEQMVQTTRAAVPGVPPDFVRMRCRDLWALTRGTRLVMNPHGLGKTYSPEEVAAALDGTEFGAQPVVVPPGGGGRVGAAAFVPPALADVLVRFFGERPAAEAVHIGWIEHPDGHQGYVLVVVTDDKQSAMQGFGSIRVQELTGGRTIDVATSPADGRPHMLSGVAPLFTR